MILPSAQNKYETGILRQLNMEYDVFSYFVYYFYKIGDKNKLI